jgi:hypothetical protein
MLEPITIVLLLSICASLLGLAFVVERNVSGAVSFLSPLVFIVTLIVFAYGVRSIFTLEYPGVYTTYGMFLPALNLRAFLQAYAAFIVGTLSLIAGFASRAYRPINRIMPALRATGVRRLYIVSAILLTVALGVFAIFVPTLIRSGAVLSLFASSSRLAFTSAWRGHGGFVFLILQAPLFLAALLYAMNVSGFTWKKIFLIASLAVVVAACFAFLGSRQELLGLLLIIVLFVHMRVRPISIWVQVAFGFGLMALGGLLGLLLLGKLGGLEHLSLGQQIGAAFVRLSGTFDQFETLAGYIRQPHQFFFGWSFIEDLYWTFVPRAIFPFKPQLFGAVRLENVLMPGLYEYSGLRATYPIGFFGECYANLGPAGLVVFPFLFGALLRALVFRNSIEGKKGLYGIVLMSLLAVGPGIVRALGGLFVAILLTVILLKVVYCVPLGRISAQDSPASG